jgi:hypothetical protein
MAIVLGMGLACVGCKDDKKDEPVDVASDEAKAEGDKDDTKDAKEDEEKAKSDDADNKDDGETKTAKADEDEKDEDTKDEDEKDEDEKDEDTEDDGETKTANAKTTGTSVPFGAGGLSACCSALDTQSKSTSGSNASRLAAASRQCFHLDQLVAQGKTTKGAALAQLKALSGVAPAACN